MIRELHCSLQGFDTLKVRVGTDYFVNAKLEFGMLIH